LGRSAPRLRLRWAPVLLAAYDSKAGQVAAWKELPQVGQVAGAVAPSPRSQSDPSEPVAVCYVSGSFNVPLPPPLPGATPDPQPDREVVVISSREGVVPFAFGSETTLPLDRPHS